MTQTLEVIQRIFDERMEQAGQYTDSAYATELKATGCEWTLGYLLAYIQRQDQRIEALESRVKNIPVTNATT